MQATRRGELLHELGMATKKMRMHERYIQFSSFIARLSGHSFFSVNISAGRLSDCTPALGSQRCCAALVRAQHGRTGHVRVLPPRAERAAAAAAAAAAGGSTLALALRRLAPDLHEGARGTRTRVRSRHCRCRRCRRVAVVLVFIIIIIIIAATTTTTTRPHSSPSAA